MAITHSRNGIYNPEYKHYVDEGLKYAMESKEPLQIVSAYSAETLMLLYKYLSTNNQKDLEDLYASANHTLSYTNENNIHLIPKKAIVVAYNNYASVLNSYPHNNFTKEKRLKLSETYISNAFKYANELKDKSILATCYATLGEIEESKGNNSLAEKNYLNAYNQIKKESELKEIRVLYSITQALSNLYEKTNNPEKALKYTKETLKYTKLAYENTLENKRKSLEIYYNFEHKNQEIQQLKEKNNLFNKQRFLYTGIALLAIIGIIFLIFLIRYKQRLNLQKTNLLISEKNETELTLQLEIEEKARLKAENELAEIQQKQLKKQALATSIQLNQKNTFINELKDKVKEEKIVKLDRILKNEKLSDNEFDNLHKIIRDIHPDFFKKLSELSIQKLTNLDYKYAAYIYLGMDNLQISNLMKVEPKTVRMTKYRMKQKIGLEKDVDLTVFLKSIDL